MDVYVVPPVGPAELLMCEIAHSTSELMHIIYQQTKKICTRLILANPHYNLNIVWEQ